MILLSQPELDRLLRVPAGLGCGYELDGPTGLWLPARLARGGFNWSAAMNPNFTTVASGPSPVLSIANILEAAEKMEALVTEHQIKFAANLFGPPKPWKPIGPTSLQEKYAQPDPKLSFPAFVDKYFGLAMPSLSSDYIDCLKYNQQLIAAGMGIPSKLIGSGSIAECLVGKLSKPGKPWHVQFDEQTALRRYHGDQAVYVWSETLQAHVRIGEDLKLNRRQRC